MGLWSKITSAFRGGGAYTAPEEPIRREEPPRPQYTPPDDGYNYRPPPPQPRQEERERVGGERFDSWKKKEEVVPLKGTRDREGTDGSKLKYALFSTPPSQPGAAYQVEVVVPPQGLSFSDAEAAIAKLPAPKAGTLRVMVEPELAAKGRAGVERVLDGQLLGWLHKEGPIDLSSVHERFLDGAPETFAAQLAGPAESRALRGPRMFAGGEWRGFGPCANYKLEIPARSPDAGAFAAEVRRAAASGQGQLIMLGDSAVRGQRGHVAAFVPPGIELDARGGYPLLIMLSGRGCPLNHWTSAGEVLPVLDEAMKGAQKSKMVTLIFDTDAASIDRGDVDRWVDFLKEALPVDGDRISIGGISMGAGPAIRVARELGSRCVSASVHSPASASASDVRELVERGVPVYLDSGAEESSMFKGTVARAAEKLAEDGVQVDARIWERKGETLGHNWESWRHYYPTWIAHHQRAQGAEVAPAVTQGVAYRPPSKDDAGKSSSNWFD